MSKNDLVHALRNHWGSRVGGEASAGAPSAARRSRARMNLAGPRLPSMPSSWPPWAQYVLAIAAVSVALVVRWVLDPYLGTGAMPFFTVFAALLVLVLVVRPGPFLVATAVGGLGAVVLFIEPRHSLSIVGGAQVLQLVLFGIAGSAAATAAWLARRVDVRRSVAEAAQARLAAIVETSGDAIMSISLDGRFLTWNKGAERLFGYRPAEAIGRRLELIVPPDRAAEERSILERVSGGEVVGPYDTVRRSKDGRSVEVSVTVSPIRDASGEVVGASKLDRDIAGRLAAERALRQSEQELREADRRKDEFLAALAHELRNPLAAVTSATELLVDASALRPEQLERAVGTVQRQMMTMVRLVDDLLDVSRITRGTLELRPEKVDLMTLVEEAVTSARPCFEAAGHMLEVSGPEDPLEFEADPVRLVQVLVNLLGNACDYTESGGRITVSVRREGREAVVEIQDTGIGIPPEELDGIFEMFTRLESPRRGQTGLGIGLTLSRQLVEMHGGTLSAESEGYGRGSTFTVRLPVAVSRRELPAQPEASTDGRGDESTGGRRVLVVDDNVDAADMLAILLEAHGNDVRTAYDGRSALAEAATFAPEAVLLDLGLPDIDGIEVCRAMRTEPWGANALIVAVSGWGQEEDKRRTAAAGFDAHLTKPARIEELTGALEKASARAAPARSRG